MPDTVVIGIAALRRMCRLISWRPGMPRLIAVCTCSRSDSSRIADLVTRATIASDESASATAGSVRCRMLLTRSVPLPRAGNQPSLTANSAISTNRGHERRDRGRDRAGHQHRGIGEARAQARQHAQPDAENQDDHRGVEHQPGRGPDPGRDQRGHVLAQRDRDAQVAVQRVVQPVPVLGEERLVQVVPRLQHASGCWPAATGRRTAPRPGCPAPGTARRRSRSWRPAGWRRASPACGPGTASARTHRPPRLFAQGANM